MAMLNNQRVHLIWLYPTYGLIGVLHLRPYMILMLFQDHPPAKRNPNVMVIFLWLIWFTIAMLIPLVIIIITYYNRSSSNSNGLSELGLFIILSTTDSDHISMLIMCFHPF